MGIPAEHPSEREGQNNNIIIKDFPGVFVRPPFFQSPPSPPPTPPSQEDDPAHPVCRSQKLRRRDGVVTRTRTRQFGEVAILHAINVRSAAALDGDAKECEFHSSNAAGDDSSSIGGYSESSAGGDAAAVKPYQGSGEDTFLLSKNGQTPDLGLAAAPVEVATNTMDSSSRWEPLSLDTSSEDISHLDDQLTYSWGDLQKDVQVQESSAQEGPTL